MSLTLALPKGGPLNNCSPIVRGLTANRTAHTRNAGPKEACQGGIPLAALEKATVGRVVQVEHLGVRAIPQMMPTMRYPDHRIGGQEKDAGDHPQPIVPARMGVEVVVRGFVQQRVVGLQEVREDDPHTQHGVPSRQPRPPPQQCDRPGRDQQDEQEIHDIGDGHLGRPIGGRRRTLVAAVGLKRVHGRAPPRFAIATAPSGVPGAILRVSPLKNKIADASIDPTAPAAGLERPSQHVKPAANAFGSHAETRSINGSCLDLERLRKRLRPMSPLTRRAANSGGEDNGEGQMETVTLFFPRSFGTTQKQFQ